MNIGDRVKIVHTPYVANSLQVGKTGRVVRMMFGLVDVVMDDGFPDGDGAVDWPFDPEELEVVA